MSICLVEVTVLKRDSYNFAEFDFRRRRENVFSKYHILTWILKQIIRDSLLYSLSME